MICALLALGSMASADDSPGRKPNIVVIVSDDAGYADFSFQGSEQIETPRIDSIASEGVRFLQGYVSASVCSPSRAGLLTGRYQQRFGHEHNFPPSSEDHVGLPLSERTLADALKPAGYRTIAMGKWHLGYGPELHPNERGFDEFYGFLQGARSYRPHEGTPRNRLQHNGDFVEESFDYMTDHLGQQAARYIERFQNEPFFLYLSFNAVHTPMHALKDDLKRVRNEKNAKRKKLVAMTLALDRAVGHVLDALERHGLEEDTLLVFVNDNGGATNNGSINAPLRGTKGTPFEGGIRVPYLMRWAGTLPSGREYEPPVSTLDIFATALAAAREEKPVEKPLDGVDLIPWIAGDHEGLPHEALFWRRKRSHAVRVEDWKLVVHKREEPLLFDLSEDPAEQYDLASEKPEVVARLQKRYRSWAGEMIDPLWNSSAKDPKEERGSQGR